MYLQSIKALLQQKSFLVLLTTSLIFYILMSQIGEKYLFDTQQEIVSLFTFGVAVLHFFFSLFFLFLYVLILKDYRNSIIDHLKVNLGSALWLFLCNLVKTILSGFIIAIPLFLPFAIFGQLLGIFNDLQPGVPAPFRVLVVFSIPMLFFAFFLMSIHVSWVYSLMKRNSIRSIRIGFNLFRSHFRELILPSAIPIVWGMISSMATFLALKISPLIPFYWNIVAGPVTAFIYILSFAVILKTLVSLKAEDAIVPLEESV